MTDNQSFEEKYLDILQSIELNINQAARRNPEMTDWEALTAVEALMKIYRAEIAGRKAHASRLSPLAEEVYETIKSVCNWRMRRDSLLDDEGNPVRSLSSPSRWKRCTNASSASLFRFEDGTKEEGERAT